MQDAVPSKTAAWVALARSLGSLAPDEARLLDDPYGARFVGRPAALLHAALAASGIVPTLLRWVPPLRRAAMYLQVRTRVIDDALRAFAAGGGRQVVLLGAGYDSRALRFSLEQLTFFEVDHPATQAAKLSVLAARRLTTPRVRYLPWDFTSRPLAELPGALAAQGHDDKTRTLTIWEGVTMYLPEAVVDASVRTIRAYSTGGSELVFTYFTRDAIAHPPRRNRRMNRLLGHVHEPWIFGWEPRALPSWLESRGFSVQRDVALHEEATERLPYAWAQGIVGPERRIAYARAS